MKNSSKPIAKSAKYNKTRCIYGDLQLNLYVIKKFVISYKIGFHVWSEICVIYLGNCNNF